MYFMLLHFVVDNCAANLANTKTVKGYVLINKSLGVTNSERRLLPNAIFQFQ